MQQPEAVNINANENIRLTSRLEWDKHLNVSLTASFPDSFIVMVFNQVMREMGFTYDSGLVAGSPFAIRFDPPKPGTGLSSTNNIIIYSRLSGR